VKKLGKGIKYSQKFSPTFQLSKNNYANI